jgi:CAAX protease family protein
MSTEAQIGVPGVATDAAENWRLVGTVAWGIGVALIFIVLQVIAAFIVVLRGQGNLDEDKLPALFESASSDGFVLSIATFVTTLVCVPLVVGIAKLKKNSNIKEYFALKPVSVSSLMGWLAILVAFIALTEVLSLILGKPIVPEFVRATYDSARPVWLLWLALVIAAPLFEETFFRGFLFKGFASSVVGPAGAIALTSILWAAIHIQYDAYTVGSIFVLGVLLGLARMRTGSLFVPLTMHAVANIVATAEAALLG